MNIKKFSVEPVSRLHLRDASDNLMYADGADGQPDKSKPMAVVLYGPGSKEYAKAQAKQNNNLIDKLKRKGKSDQTAEQRAEETAEFLAGCTKAFENVEYDALEGDALAKAIYKDQSLGFVAEQVNKHITEWGNFSPASSKN